MAKSGPLHKVLRTGPFSYLRRSWDSEWEDVLELADMIVDLTLESECQELLDEAVILSIF